MGERRARRARPPRPRAAARPRRRDRRALRARRRPRRRASATSPPASASGSRSSSACAATRDRHLRRADVGAHAGRESEQLFAVLRVAVVRRGHGRWRCQPQARRDPPRHRRGDDHARAAGSSTALPTADATPATLAQAMVGRPVSLRSEAAALGAHRDGRRRDGARREAHADGGRERAGRARRARRRRCTPRDGRRAARRPALDVHAGEIVGLAGVEGNGQAALADVLSSLVAARRAARCEVGGAAVPTGEPGRWPRPASA